jgi:hypothetical protein
MTPPNINLDMSKQYLPYSCIINSRFFCFIESRLRLLYPIRVIRCFYLSIRVIRVIYGFLSAKVSNSFVTSKYSGHRFQENFLTDLCGGCPFGVCCALCPLCRQRVRDRLRSRILRFPPQPVPSLTAPSAGTGRFPVPLSVQEQTLQHH